MQLRFGNVVHPPYIDRLIPDGENGAWNDLGQRRAVGVCQHSMVGTLWGTDRWFRRGRGVSTGLTDYGIGNFSDGPLWDGVILRWNDPLGAAHDVLYVDTDPSASSGQASARHRGRVSSNRAGWANGGVDGLEGDGPLFVRTLGIHAVNRDLVSIERSDGGDTTAPMSPKQFERICALSAYWFDQAKVPWDAFPLNPRYGIVTHLLHKEFAAKDCPHTPVYSRIEAIQNRIRAILKAAQTGADEPAEVPPGPHREGPDHDRWPRGWREADLAFRFGELPRQNEDGSREAFRFDPKGPISNAWAHRGGREGFRSVADLPRPLGWYVLQADADQRQELVIFDGAPARAWTLYRPDPNVAWRWVQ